MAKQNRNQAQPEGVQKDPDQWVTGDESMTGPQASYLHTLATEAGEEVAAGGKWAWRASPRAVTVGAGRLQVFGRDEGGWPSLRSPRHSDARLSVCNDSSESMPRLTPSRTEEQGGARKLPP